MHLYAQDRHMGRDRNESGRYDDRIDPTTVLDVFEAREDQARPLTAGDIVDELDIARRTAHNKLNALVERGVLETRKVGARGRVWWTPQYDAESGRERAETPTRNPRDQQDAPADTTAHTPERDPENDPREILDALGRPGSGTDYEHRLDAVVTMYELLQANAGDRVSKGDFEELLAGEDVGYGGGFDSLWSNWVKANENAGRPENALAVLPGVEQRGDDYVYQP
jgi:hypothetical protein